MSEKGPSSLPENMKPPEGCCSGCRGTGYTYDPSTGGRCWDCRGTGCAHPEPCHDEFCEAEFISGPNAWSPCACEQRRPKRHPPGETCEAWDGDGMGGWLCVECGRLKGETDIAPTDARGSSHGA